MVEKFYKTRIDFKGRAINIYEGVYVPVNIILTKSDLSKLGYYNQRDINKVADEVTEFKHIDLFNIEMAQVNHESEIEVMSEVDKQTYLPTKSIKQYVEEPVPEIEWLVPDLIPGRGITIFGGTSGSMKSWAGMQLSLACAAGKDFLNQFSCKKVPVLYIDEENGDVTMPNRFNRLIKGHDYNYQDMELNFSVFNNITLDDVLGKTKLRQLIDKFKPRLVIIDSMVRCIDGQEDKASDVKRIFENLKEFSNMGIAFVILHHTVKSNGKTMEGLRGSGDFAAFAECVIMFSKSGGNYCNCNIVKNRHIEINEESCFFFELLTVSADNIQLDYCGQRSEKGNVVDNCAKDIMKLIVENDIVIYNSGTFFEKLSKLSHSKNSYYSALKKLCETGKLFKMKKGNYKVLDTNIEVQEEIVYD